MTLAMRHAAVLAGCALLLLMPLAATPVLPLIDFYNHVARYFVLSHIDGNALLSANYAAAWMLLPNLGLDAIATPLLAVVPPLLAAKLIAGGILLVQFSGVLFLHRTLHGRADMLPVTLLLGLLYSYIFNWGFSNFLLGTGLVFWNLGLWFSLRDRLALAVVAASIGALVIFFCHGFAFAIYGVLLGGFEFGRWLDGRGRSVPALARTVGLLAVQAIMPAILFLQMPTSAAQGRTGSTIDAIARHSNGGSLAERLDVEFWHRLSTIFRVAESPYPALDVFTFCVVAAVLGVGLWKGWFQFHRQYWPVVAITALLCLLTPPSLFGVGYVSDRLPLVLAMLLAAVLVSARPLSRQGRLAVGMLGVVAIVRLAAITIGWTEYASHYADFRQVASVIPRGALVTEVLPSGHDRRDGLLPRCQMYRPLLVVLNDNAAALFADPSQQPLRLAGPVKAAQGDTIERRDLRVHYQQGFFDEALADIAADSRYDYVVMCGRERLTRPLPAGLRIAAEKGGITVLKVD